MKLDALNQGRMQILCGYLADRSLPDSPDGPLAAEVRERGESPHLDEAAIEWVIAAAAMQLELRRDLLEVRPLTVLERASLFIGSTATADNYRVPLYERDPEFLATQAASELYNLFSLGRDPISRARQTPNPLVRLF